MVIDEHMRAELVEEEPIERVLRQPVPQEGRGIVKSSLLVRGANRHLQFSRSLRISRIEGQLLQQSPSNGVE